MSSDGDKNPLKSLAPKTGGNFFEDLFTNVVNYGLQGATGGIAGYDGGLNFNGGASTDSVVAGTKEITGAAAAEEANRIAMEQFEEQKAAADADRAAAIQQTARDQVSLSQKAAAARSAGTKTSSANRGQAISGGSLGTDEKDFLGL